MRGSKQGYELPIPKRVKNNSGFDGNQRVNTLTTTPTQRAKQAEERKRQAIEESIRRHSAAGNKKPQRPLQRPKSKSQKDGGRIQGGVVTRRRSESPFVMRGGRRRKDSAMTLNESHPASSLDASYFNLQESPIRSASPETGNVPFDEQLRRASLTPLPSPSRSFANSPKRTNPSLRQLFRMKQKISVSASMSMAAEGGGLGEGEHSSFFCDSLLSSFSREPHSFQLEREVSRVVQEGLGNISVEAETAPPPVQTYAQLSVSVNNKSVPIIDCADDPATSQKVNTLFQLHNEMDSSAAACFQENPFTMYIEDEEEGLAPDENGTEVIAGELTEKLGVNEKNAATLLRVMLADPLLKTRGYPTDSVLRLSPFIHCWNDFYRRERYGAGLPEIKLQLVDADSVAGYQKTIVRNDDSSYTLLVKSSGSVRLQLGDISDIQLFDFIEETRVKVRLDAEGELQLAQLEGIPTIRLTDSYTCEFEDESQCALSELFLRSVTEPFFTEAIGLNRDDDSLVLPSQNFQELTRIILNTVITPSIKACFLNGGEAFLVEAGHWKFLAEHGYFPLLLTCYEKGELTAEQVGTLFIEYHNFAGLLDLKDVSWLSDGNLKTLLIRAEYDVLVKLGHAEVLYEAHKYGVLAEHHEWGYLFKAWLSDLLPAQDLSMHLQSADEESLREQIIVWAKEDDRKIPRALIFYYMQRFPTGQLCKGAEIPEKHKDALKWVREQLELERVELTTAQLAEESILSMVTQEESEDGEETEQSTWLSGAVEADRYLAATNGLSQAEMISCVARHEWGPLREVSDWSWLDQESINILLHQRQYTLLFQAEQFSLLAKHGKTDLLEEHNKLGYLVEAHLYGHWSRKRLFAHFQMMSFDLLSRQMALWIEKAKTKADCQVVEMLCSSCENQLSPDDPMRSYYKFVAQLAHYATHTAATKRKPVMKALSTFVAMRRDRDPAALALTRISGCVSVLNSFSGILGDPRHKTRLILLVFALFLVFPPSIALSIPLMLAKNTKGLRLLKEAIKRRDALPSQRDVCTDADLARCGVGVPAA